METKLVRLKRYDPRRGHLLRRFTYRGIKFHEERGWYRVDEDIAEYLTKIHQKDSDRHSHLAFDVCTDEEAKRIDAKEKEEQRVRRQAESEIKLSEARKDGKRGKEGSRGDLTVEDLKEGKINSDSGRKTKKS